MGETLAFSGSSTIVELFIERPARMGETLAAENALIPGSGAVFLQFIFKGL